jgi:DNA polymerase-3 subunit epsilon
MQLSLALDEYVVFDFETTGLSPWAGDEVVEVAAIKVFGDAVDESNVFQTLVNPRRPISPEASRINGITDAMVVSAPTIEEVLPKFFDFIGSAWLVAQNAKFDMSFLMKYMMKLNVRRSFEVYDTMHLSRRLHADAASHNLDQICQRLGIAYDPGTRHRSLADVRLTAHAFVRLKEQLGDRLPNREKWSI